MHFLHHLVNFVIRIFRLRIMRRKKALLAAPTEMILISRVLKFVPKFSSAREKYHRENKTSVVPQRF